MSMYYVKYLHVLCGIVVFFFFGLGVILFPRFFGTFLFFLLVLDTFKVASGKPAYTEYCF